ncbi:MAG: hypothetical protein WA020_03015, partial [Candidatus Acidiferrales bacterium]
GQVARIGPCCSDQLERRIETTRKREQKGVACAFRPLLVTAIFTGLRCSELRGLTWQHADLEKKVVHVRQRADFENRMGPPKSEAGPAPCR